MCYKYRFLIFFHFSPPNREALSPLMAQGEEAWNFQDQLTLLFMVKTTAYLKQLKIQFPIHDVFSFQSVFSFPSVPVGIESTERFMESLQHQQGSFCSSLLAPAVLHLDDKS